MSLLDKLQPLLNQKPQPKPMSGTQTSLGLLRAKLGTQAQPGEPVVSDQLEQVQMAAQPVQAQQSAQLAQSGMQVAQDAQQSEFATAQQRQQQQMLDVKSQAQLKSNQLAQELRQGRGQADTKDRGLQMEQIAFGTRLQSQDYVDRLQSEGAKQRLDTAQGMQDAINNMVFNGFTHLFRDDIAFRNLMQADTRAFNEKAAQLDINFALDVAKAAAAQENARLIASGVGTAATAYASSPGEQVGETTAPGETARTGAYQQQGPARP